MVSLCRLVQSLMYLNLYICICLSFSPIQMSLSLYLHLYFYLNQGWLEKGCTQSPHPSFDVSGLRRGRDGGLGVSKGWGFVLVLLLLLLLLFILLVVVLSVEGWERPLRPPRAGSCMPPSRPTQNLYNKNIACKLILQGPAT